MASRTTQGPAPNVRLVRNTPSASPPLAFDSAQRQVIEHNFGVLRVLGGPGTGKTSVLEQAAAQRISAGADPGSVLVLTFGRRAASAMRDRITASAGVALREPPVRSVQSYAFAILARAAARQRWEQPRLITGPEQDMIIRELISGALAGEGAVNWPGRLRAALPTRGFARELRDIMMRCAERGISASELASLGREHLRDDWIAVAQFIPEYAGVSGLRDPGAYDPAELVRAVLDTFELDPELLAEERARLRHVYLDEAQDIDPAQARLVELVSVGATSIVVAGDPDQSIFGFRGADPRLLVEFARDLNAQTVVLPHTYRAPGQLTAVFNSLAARLPGPAAQRNLTSAATAPADGVQIGIAVGASEAREATLIANQLRRAHLLDGVQWSQMAVIVRSLSSSLPALRRAFSAAEVPLTMSGDDVPVAENLAVRSLLAIVRLALLPGSLDAIGIEEVLCSPYIGLDSLAVRRLRRVLRQLELAAGGTRSSSTVLVDMLADPRELIINESLATRPLTRLTRILTKIRQSAAAGADPEELLYAAWVAVGVQDQWRADALRPGLLGSQADARLDGIVAMFDAAAAFVQRLRAADIRTFLDYIEGQELPADRLSASAPSDGAVRVVTAHNSKGLQWEVVAVAGVQEGQWPNLVPRGSLLGSELLVDLAAALDPATALSGATRTAQMMAEERRLFYVAVTRARSQLLVTAQEGGDQRPSQFLLELSDLAGVAVHRPTPGVIDRGLSTVDTIAELRAAVIDPTQPLVARTAAARSLASFAEVGIAGADPQDWYGVSDSSDDRPLLDADQRVDVSPSKVEMFTKCQLRWLLERVGAAESGFQAGVGTLLHSALESLGDTAGRSQRQLVAELTAHVDAGWDQIEFAAAWESRLQRANVTTKISNLAAWLVGNPREYVDGEARFRLEVGRAVIHGSIDRLERGADGRIITVDLKTGNTITCHADMPAHAQLGIYQLAVDSGALADQVGAGAESGGGELLFVKSSVTAANRRAQGALADQDDPAWASDLVGVTAEAMAGSSFLARRGDQCRMCPVTQSCPLQPGGRQVAG